MNKRILKAFLLLGGLSIIIASSIAYLIYHVQNPDMTDLRLFISNPWPTVACLGGWLFMLASSSIK